MTRLTLRTMTAAVLVIAVSLTPGAAAPDPARVEELQRRLNHGQHLSDAEVDELLRAMPAEEVDVDLIMVPVLVTSRWGRPLTGLRQKDFSLEVGGRRLPLAFFNSDNSLPLRLAILLDVSGSMAQDEQHARLKDALTAVLSTLRRGDQMQLMTFASAEVRTQREWTDEVTDLVHQALEVPASGETAIVDALREASRLMPEPDRSRPAILLVTDGLENASSGSVQDAIEAARAIGTPIYVLGLGGLDRQIQDRGAGNSPWDPLRVVAEQSGGAFFEVLGEEQAQRAAEQLANELRHQYWLAFKPSGPADGRFRPIKVSVDRGGARIRSRSGYK